MPLDSAQPADAAAPPSIGDQISTARQAGYSDQEIAGYLKQSQTWAPRFDAASKAGYSDEEVFGHLGLNLGKPAAAPDKDQPGFFGTLGRAAVRGAVESGVDTAHAATPFRDRPQAAGAPADPVQAELQKSFLNGGWHDPNWWAANIGHGLGSSVPSLAMGAAGAAAGAALGSEAPVVGNIGGAALGGAGGFALGSALQTLAPAYQKARNEGLSHDAAVDRALGESGIAGAFGAVSGLVPGMSLFGRAAPAAGEALGALKRPISEALAQVFGVQPAVGVGQAAATAAAEGRMPTADELATAYAGQAGAGVALTGAHSMLPGGKPPPAEPPAAEPAAAQGMRPENAPAPGATPPAQPSTAAQSPAPTIPPLPPGARPLDTLEAMAAGAKPPAAPPVESKPPAAPPPQESPAPAPPSAPPAVPEPPPRPAPVTMPPPEPAAPARIRTIQQIMDQDGISAPKAKAVQQAEIEALGRPITEEERQARAAGVAAAPPRTGAAPDLAVNDQNAGRTPQEQTRPDSAAPAPSGETLYDRVPTEPTRLTQFLRSIGGVQDPGGDVRSTLGGAKYRPGLISKRGRTLDDAAQVAWENGYFPQHGEDRPTINDLLEALDDDVRGRPAYSHHDIDAADAYNSAIEHNSEVDRLASQHGIDTNGLTREQFYAEVAKRMPSAEAERDQQASTHQDAYRQMERAARDEATAGGEPWHASDFYGASQTRSLEDLEREDQQANASLAAAERPGRHAQPDHFGADEGAGEEGGGPRGGGAGAGQGASAEENPNGINRGAFSFAQLIAKNRENAAAAKRLAATGETTLMRDPRYPDHFVIVSPDVRSANPEGWRITRFGADGEAHGHSEHDSAEQAYRDAIMSGYRPSTEEGLAHAPYVYHPLDVNQPTAGRQFFHGTKAPIDSLKDADVWQYSQIGNLYGHGLYLTDNPEVARSYAEGKGKGEPGRVYPATLRNLRLVDLESPLPPDAVEAFKQAAGQYLPHDVDFSRPGKEVFGEIKEGMRDEDLTTGEASEVYDAISAALSDAGYDGFRHEGGNLRGKELGPHNVAILFEDAAHDAAGNQVGRALADKFDEPQGLAQRRINVAGQGDIFGGGQEPRAPREAEPTIRNDKRQDVLPGMEASARQAQAARDQAGPRSDQRAADEGLFAPRRQEAQQEALFGAKPEGAPAKSMFAAPGARDELTHFPPYQPHEAHAVSADWVVAKGRETGHEHLAIVRNDRGIVIHASTDGRPDAIAFNPAEMAGHVDMLTMHHNHPNSLSISKPDLMALTTPAISHIVAHAHDGNTYIVSLAGKYRGMRGDSSAATNRLLIPLILAFNHAVGRMSMVMRAAIRRDGVSVADVEKYTNDVVMRLLHSEGFVDYQTTKVLPEALAEPLKAEIATRGQFNASNRSTWTLRPEERVASLPGPEPAGARPGQSGNAGGDQGRGALPAGARQARLLESSSLRDAAQEAAMGALREEAARLPDLKPEEERRIGPLRSAVLSVMDRVRDVGAAAQQMLAPMSTGTKRAQAFAADFANAMRQVSFRYGSIDKELTRNFSPKQRDAMGRALDAQSVHEQQVRDLPPAEQEAARAAFEAGKTGISSLPADQQRALHLLDRLSQDVWRRMQERGMVAPNARPIPWYFSRQILMHDEDGVSRPGAGKGGGGNRGLEPIGRNLTTAGPMRREHLTPEETEANAKKALGSGATLLRDIRSLVSKLQQNERAIGGVDLMSKIDEVGKSTGVNLVLKGDIPGLLHPGDYFTIADHPSFRQFTGSGWRAIHVSREFEGPLKAVLSKAPDAWYRGAMQVKGGVMSAIMYSPFIHLAVELGRALPVMPGKVLSLSALRDGSRLRRDLEYMDTATRDGLAPLGHRWAADPVSIADQANPQNRGKFATMLGNARDAVANAAGKVGGEFLHDVVQHPHQALLWDQVFNLQVGIYNTLRDKWIAKGFDPQVAGTAAAHMANRYAGALPAEHLSRGANMAANLLLFSRSFTLGNLGVMKDMMTGAPSHVLARMEQLAGPAQAKAMQSVLRRKAMSAFVLDIGLYYMANALLQAGIQAVRQGPAAAADDWQKKAAEALSEVAGGNPLAIFGVLPQHWNEPGRENRIYAGTDESGKGIYLRLPAGKVGEEFVGWMSKPGTMLEDKMSPLVRPLIELVMGHDSLGRQLLPPHPKTIGDYVDTAGAIVEHIASNLGPTSTIQGVADLARSALTGQKSQSDSGVTLAKVLGPMTGLAQVSSGRPGGPVAGEIAAQAETSRYNVAAAMPSIRRKIVNGDTQGAVADMTALGVAPGLIRYYVDQTLHPHATKGQIQGFSRTATPEEKTRLGMFTQ